LFVASPRTLHQVWKTVTTEALSVVGVFLTHTTVAVLVNWKRNVKAVPLLEMQVT